MQIKYRNEIVIQRWRLLGKFVAVGGALAATAFMLVLINIQLPTLLLTISGWSHADATVLAARYSVASPAKQIVQPAAFTTSISTLDVRAFVLDEWFRANNSPMYGAGKAIVDACVRLDAPPDCTIIATIARVETNLCKYLNSADYYNCWGFGGPPGHRQYFDSWEASIDRVYSALVHSYGNSFILDPKRMENIYCGPQPECDNWGNRVNFFTRELDQFSRDLGFGSLFELRD